MIQSLVGKKLGQTQGFLENGARVPMTRIWVKGNVVSQIKTTEKEGYEAVQLGFGETKKASKPLNGHSKKAGLKITPRFFRESREDKIEGIELGQEINAEEVISPGDIVDITGVSKGKGFAGVVKRYHFKGGPKTHGQSDRHRAPGAIGQGTTPGRVYKGKRMAGRMGNAQVTVKNLEIIDLKDGELLVKGLIPGSIGTVVTITRRGINKKHVGLYKTPIAEEVILDTAVVEEIGPSVEEQDALRQVQDEQEKAKEREELLAKQMENQVEDAESNSVSEDKIEKASDTSADVEVLEEAKEEEDKASV